MAEKFGMTAREKRHNEALARYWGQQYAGLAPWNDNTKTADEKAPRLVWRIEALLVDTVNDYLFGEMRSPTFAVEGGTLSDAERAALTERIAAIYQQSGLREGLSEVGRLGLTCASVGVSCYYARDEGAAEAGGRHYAEVFATGAAIPTFGRDDRKAARAAGIDYDDLLRLDERWQSIKTLPGGKEEMFYHRRLWLPDRTIEYVPVSEKAVKAALDAGADINWREDKKASAPPHNLGFVPVEWIPNGGFVVGEVDGFHLIDPADYALADAINQTFSQTDRAIKYNQDPWLAFLNADIEPDKLKKGGGRTLDVRANPASSGTADAKLLEMSGGGQTAALAFVQQARLMLTQVARVILHNPEQWSGALSGVALERLLAPMLTMVARLRAVYGARLARLMRKMVAAERGGMAALGGAQVVAKWGPLIEPNDNDASLAIVNAISALDAGFITFERAVAHVAPYFGVESAQALIAELRAEGTGGQDDNPDNTPANPTNPA